LKHDLIVHFSEGFEGRRLTNEADAGVDGENSGSGCGDEGECENRPADRDAEAAPPSADLSDGERH
jgi:hypothetical protein